MQVWPILAVSDVSRSASWYERLLSAVTRADATSKDFDQILTREGDVMLCLHRWLLRSESMQHEGAALSDPQRCPTGHGLLLWFLVDDFDDTWGRAQELQASIVETPSLHRGTGFRAFVVRDPDGYHVAINESRSRDNK
jgi:hypothetical protein